MKLSRIFVGFAFGWLLSSILFTPPFQPFEAWTAFGVLGVALVLAVIEGPRLSSAFFGIALGLLFAVAATPSPDSTIGLIALGFITVGWILAFFDR